MKQVIKWKDTQDIMRAKSTIPESGSQLPEFVSVPSQDQRD